MLGLLFNPDGKINSKMLLKGGGIIILLGFIKNMVPYFIGENSAFGMISLVLALVFAYCWIALWLKRYRGAEKSGGMVFLPILAFIVLFIIVWFMSIGGIMMEAMTLAMENPENPEAIEAMMEEKYGGTEFQKSLTLKYSLLTAAASAIVLFVFDKLIGPAVAMDS